MDPNAALETLRSLLGRSQEDLDRCPQCALAALEDAAEAFVALDGWLKKGGFLPSSWDPNRIHQPEEDA